MSVGLLVCLMVFNATFNNIKLRNQLGRRIPTNMSRSFWGSEIDVHVVDIVEIVNYHCLNNEGKSE